MNQRILIQHTGHQEYPFKLVISHRCWCQSVSEKCTTDLSTAVDTSESVNITVSNFTAVADLPVPTHDKLAMNSADY